ncbi:MAG: SIR2 family protein [Actinomycetota bacterium]
MSEDPRAAVAELVQRARQGRLVLYTGAGLSLAEPAAGPRSWQLADRLRPAVAELLGVDLETLAGDNLERLGARVVAEAADKMSELRRRAANAAPFCTMEPNYGHEAVALLMREGVVKAVTANWDLGIETAGTRLDIKIAGVTTALERAALGQQLPLYKVHGCASRPETLKATREEVDEPMKWARAEVQQALVDGTVVFIGLGTIGAYVSEPFDELVPLWRAAGATIKVVDPELSKAWREALGDDADGVHIDADAAEFLDDLLRAIAREALGQAAQRIRVIQDEQAAWTRTMLDGIERLDEALRDATGQAVLRWMRDGVTHARDGSSSSTTRASNR